ncbi:penicillin-binding protein activator [Hoeflea prorocentri]|uniref:Penicillin-binding protein activator n=1 Tax=Hoeflea prorocentri TaxID=1922333 RepID=A0A9X3ULX9_9HYPH|nr:penicillin-binding protein activator [Hoeflea prorocentri]MCY6383047.1 penicillin-binding protein activator [Hoeflea prorocentri]MDA5400847.1 penicillin-binding protein activator [Hoeflea prorocentri]
MRRIFGKAAQKLTIPALLGAALVLSSCQAANYGLPQGSGPTEPAPLTSLPVKTGPATGEVLGTGVTRVALLLPLSAPGNGATIAREYRNAAELAIETRGQQSMELVIKDTTGTAAGAIARTEEAIREGSAIILGPVFSGSVTSAASVAGPQNRVMIAFSSDPSAASGGVFLMSFLPNQVVDRTVSYATGIGLTSFTAILPNGAYGALVERQLRATLQARGGVLNGVSRYDYNNESVVAAVQQVLPAVEQSDAIFIPDGGTAPIAIARVLQSEGVKLRDKRLIGTGQWRSSKLSSPFLQGAIFADMDQSGFEAFKVQYKERFQADPTVNAGLGYDAVTMVADLLTTGNPAALSRQSIERPRGFRGVTGIFRFQANGDTQRGLAVYQVQEGDVTVVDPAPQQFSTFDPAQF